MGALIFLHGALGSQNEWKPILEKLERKDSIHLINFPGHGGTPCSQKDCKESLDSLVDAVKAHIKGHQIKEFTLIGYSLGGYVALRLGAEQIDGLSRIITLATKTRWNPEITILENSKLSMERLLPLQNKLELEHGQTLDQIINMTHSIIDSIGKSPISSSDLKQITCPVKLLIGESDRMVSIEETEQFSSEIINGSHQILVNQGHFIDRMDSNYLAQIITDFIQ